MLLRICEYVLCVISLKTASICVAFLRHDLLFMFSSGAISQLRDDGAALEFDCYSLEDILEILINIRPFRNFNIDYI